MEPAIKLENLTKSFADSQKKYNSLVEYLSDPKRLFYSPRRIILDDLNLNVAQGETFGILGNNGSGKSTLLKTIAGIYKPDAGAVKLNGSLVPLLELGVGFHPELSARENIYLNGVILGMRRSFIKEHFEKIVEFAELQQFLELPLKNFSTGMQVRLAFSIAFTVEADIYLLDEVFAVGDIGFQQKSLDVLKDLRSKGKTIILVSHNLEMMEKFCDRLALIRNGKIESVGNPAEVVAHYGELEHVATKKQA